jgi:hypothetical protein
MFGQFIKEFFVVVLRICGRGYRVRGERSGFSTEAERFGGGIPSDIVGASSA